MRYIHQYFKLDTDARKVFDENEKELRLKGNAFLFLEFLCEKYPKGVTITDINDNFIAPVKSKKGEYSEDYIRNLRNVITRAISRDVIEYKNAVYSIVGEVKKTESISSVEPAKSFLHKIFKNKTSRIILISLFCVVIVLLLAYGYYFQKHGQPSVAASKIENDMVLIPAGNFLMGSTEQEIQNAYNICLADEGTSCNKPDFFSQYPQIQVYLPAFYIDKQEVSNSDYKIFVDATKRQAPHFWNDTNLNNPVQPVVGVTWNDASDYCKWIGKRLPTESEWEKAARGTDGRTWPWGNTWDDKKANHGAAGQNSDASDGYYYSAPVAVALGVSPYGVLDMAGNVYEWVNSQFNAYPGNDKYINQSFNSSFEVMRGGSYLYTKSYLMAASRQYDEVDAWDPDVGFRCTKDAK